MLELLERIQNFKRTVMIFHFQKIQQIRNERKSNKFNNEDLEKITWKLGSPLGNLQSPFKKAHHRGKGFLKIKCKDCKKEKKSWRKLHHQELRKGKEKWEYDMDGKIIFSWENYPRPSEQIYCEDCSDNKWDKMLTIYKIFLLSLILCFNMYNNNCKKR